MFYKKLLLSILFVFSFNCLPIYNESNESEFAQGSYEECIPNSQGSFATEDSLVIEDSLDYNQIDYSQIEITSKKRNYSETKYIKALISKKDDISEELQNYISKETKNIKLAIYWIYDWYLAGALVTAKLNRNIPVEIIMDKSSLSYESDIFNFLKKHVDVYLYDSPKVNTGKYWTTPLMHNKFLLLENCKIINDASPKKLSFTGSYNYTEKANKFNEENVLIIEDEEVYNKFSNRFEELKTKIKNNDYN